MENEATNIIDNHTIEEIATFKFLEATVHIRYHEISVSHWNKNDNTIRNSQRQKRFRYHHFESFTPKTQKMGTIIGTIIRMERYSSHKRDLIKSIHLTIEELMLLSYPMGFIQETLRKIFHSNPQKWNFIPDILHDERYQN